MSRSGAAYLLPGQAMMTPLLAGTQYVSQGMTSYGTVANPADATGRWSPFWVPNPGGVTVATLRVRTTVAGSAGAVGRLGIWNETGAGVPTSLVLDAGTVDETAAPGALAITVNRPLPQGAYWLGYVPQGAPVTHATITTIAAGVELSQSSFVGANVSYGVTGNLGAITGALASNPVITSATTTPFAVGVVLV